MTQIIKPGAGILFMKVGTHANESLESIIARKTKEIDKTGYAMWGYGGNTCHPRTMVQPFAEALQLRNEPIYLCMHQMESKHFAEQLRAKEYSVDGVAWHEVPKSISVLGSRFALMIRGLRAEEFVLPLDRTRVAVGMSKGKAGSKYIHGRVDKACLEVTDRPVTKEKPDPIEAKISLVAELAAPYAVLLRGYD